jgi:hypothetical protein
VHTYLPSASPEVRWSASGSLALLPRPIGCAHNSQFQESAMRILTLPTAKPAIFARRMGTAVLALALSLAVTIGADSAAQDGEAEEWPTELPGSSGGGPSWIVGECSASPQCCCQLALSRSLRHQL